MMRLKDVSWKESICMEELILFGVDPLENMAEILQKFIRDEFEEEDGSNEQEVDRLVFMVNELSNKIDDLKEALVRLDRERRGLPAKEKVDEVWRLLDLENEKGIIFNQRKLVTLVSEKGEKWAMENRDLVINEARHARRASFTW